MAQIKHPLGALHTGNIADDLATTPEPLQLVVVSPARPVWEGRCRWVDAAGRGGQMGIWPRHTDMVAALGVGRLRIGVTGDGEIAFAIWGGFLQVAGNKVTVLVDRAAAPEDVDEAAVRKELEETLAALRHPKTDEEYDELRERRKWCKSRLRILPSDVPSQARSFGSGSST